MVGFWFWGVWIARLYVALICLLIFLYSILWLNRMGTIVAGCLSGWKLVYFHQFSFSWVREDGELVFKKIKKGKFLPEFQMEPPKNTDLLPYVFHFYGGSFALLLLCLVFSWFCFGVFRNNTLWMLVFLLPFVLSFVLFFNGFFQNGIIRQLRTSKEAREAMSLALQAGAEVAMGKRQRDFEEGTFRLPENADLGLIPFSALVIWEAGRLCDLCRYQEGMEVLEKIPIYKLPEGYRTITLIHKLYYYCTDGFDPSRAKDIFERTEIQGALRAKRFSATFAAYTFFIEKDYENGYRLLEQAKKENALSLDKGNSLMESERLEKLEQKFDRAYDQYKMEKLSKPESSADMALKPIYNKFSQQSNSKKKRIKYPLVFYSFLVSLLIGGVIAIIYSIASGFFWDTMSFIEIAHMALNSMLMGMVFGFLYAYPIVLTLLNTFFLARKVRSESLLDQEKMMEGITMLLGILLSFILFAFSEIRFADWQEVLMNQERHTPIFTGSLFTIVIFSLSGLSGYFFLSFKDVRNTPPLLTVLAIAALYLGIVVCIFWIVQIWNFEPFEIEDLFLGSNNIRYLILLPLNFIVLSAKLIRCKILDWKDSPESVPLKNPFLEKLNQKLVQAKHWPIAAFLFMWPLLGIVIAILLLFGQRPDSVIRAWTETSGWNLSTKVSPPNLYVDPHYLCTVAARGHGKLVKPLRIGKRQGHDILVNRQLSIANAFEQILEEKVSRFHRHLRSFYDKYGLPVAKLIRTPLAADVVYLVMKPLEWIFLAVIYLVDVKPENRIATQYMLRRLP